MRSKSILELDEAIRLDKNDAAAYCDRGISYKRQGDVNQAIKDYDEAIRLKPNFAIAYYNRGIAYASKGNLAQAMNDYSEAIRLNPRFVYAYNNRGNVYSSQRNFKQAIDNYNKAIRLDPNYAGAYFNRSVAYHKDYNLQECVSDLVQAMRLNPQHIDSYFEKKDYQHIFNFYMEHNINELDALLDIIPWHDLKKVLWPNLAAAAYQRKQESLVKMAFQFECQLKIPRDVSIHTMGFFTHQSQLHGIQDRIAKLHSQVEGVANKKLFHLAEKFNGKKQRNHNNREVELTEMKDYRKKCR